MSYLYNKKLRVAYEKADEVVKKVLSQKTDVNATSVLDYLAKNLNIQIEIIAQSLELLDIKEQYGSMMLIEKSEDEYAYRVKIVLNVDNDMMFQRFALLHELGHLATMSKEELDKYIDKYNDKYVVSTHVHYKIGNISEEDCENNGDLLKEQIANIFALRVLMPSSIFYDKMLERKDICAMGAFFGVPPEAVVSRMQLGA